MSGAERRARARRQGQGQTTGGKAVAATRNTGDRRKVIIGVVVVLVLAGAALAGVIISNNQKNTTEGKDIAAATTPNSAKQSTSAAPPPAYPMSREEGVVVVGADDAKVTLDVYEDFLCPACRAFEEEYGKDIEGKVTNGTVRVRYHMLPMLNEKSDPAGYSMDSANAGLCAADAGIFPAYHKSLFTDQPEEGTRGWDRQQLARLGGKLGVTSPDFTSCVEGGKYNSLVQANFDEVRKTAYLQQTFPDGQKGFGTPTIAVGEKIVEPSDSKWLDKLVSANS